MSILNTLTVNGTTYKVAPVVPASSVTLLASKWQGDGDKYSQVVEVPEVTANTKVDLQPTSEQLIEFHYKVLAFVAENDGGTVTVYAIGDKPTDNHTIQITKTEVKGNGKIRGNTVGTTMPRPDWNQTDPTKADYIRNKPEFSGDSNGVPFGAFYENFEDAIYDVNYGEITRNTSVGNATVKVFTADNGAKTVMLLDDVSVDTQIDVTTDMTLVLNGHTINFTTAAAYLNIYANCVINGEVVGSTIRKSVDGNNLRFISVENGSLKMIGGTYHMDGHFTGKLSMIRGTASCESMELLDCVFVMTNEGASADSQLTKIAQTQGKKLHIKDSTLNLRTAYGETVAVHTLGEALIENSSITATGDYGAVRGVQLSAESYESDVASKIINSTIFTDAPQDNVDEEAYAVGVSSHQVLSCVNTNVTGTHSSLEVRNSTYIYGGLLNGYCHGLYMIPRSGRRVYVKDATLKSGVYTGGYTPGPDDAFSIAYLGSSEFDSNGEAYFDGCTFEGICNETLVIRQGPDEDHKNIMHLSNITNNAKYKDNPGVTRNWFRLNGYQSGTGYCNYLGAELKFGMGCNEYFRPENTTRPDCAEITGKLYRRTADDMPLNGKDFDALQSSIPNQMVVKFVSDGYVSHTAMQIYDHVKAGGTAVLLRNDQYLTLLDYVTEVATFVTGLGDEPGLLKIKVWDDASVEFYEERYITNATATLGTIEMMAVLEDGSTVTYELYGKVVG